MTHFLFAAWLASCSADATTTHIGLNRGAHERILTQNPWVNDALIGGEAAGVASVLHHYRRENPKVTMILLAAITSYRIAVVAHNLRTIQLQGAR